MRVGTRYYWDGDDDSIAAKVSWCLRHAHKVSGGLSDAMLDIDGLASLYAAYRGTHLMRGDDAAKRAVVRRYFDTRNL